MPEEETSVMVGAGDREEQARQAVRLDGGVKLHHWSVRSLSVFGLP